MTLTWRKNALTERHRALGATLEPWNGMPTAWTYDDDIDNGYIAIRTKAGLMDISGLNVVHVIGAHAEWVLNRTVTRDVRKIYPGKAAYATMLDDRGMLVDDGIIYRTGPNSWLVVHGSGTTLEQLNKEAVGRDVAVLFDSDVQILSLQGPLSVDFLEKHVPGIRDLKYFHHMDTQLFGHSVLISRTGYTGERGYEIFCKFDDAVDIWDTILQEGQDEGIIPVQFSTLDMFRVEGALFFFPDDMSEAHPFENDMPGDSLWELGLTFTVSPTNEEFRGIAQHQYREGKERFKMYGVELDSDQPAEAGDRVLDAQGNDVGVVTCGMYSPLTKRSVALARLNPDLATPDVPVQVQGEGDTTAAKTHSLPFEDPQKKKPRGKA
ncbi:aminomethyltransferase family protein [Yaniella flava]|uniref:Aminomethyltransferase family protein n=1 Tax=Yaniella flava TaxID=287930 RepID=A0ABN2V525_9MICC